MVHSCCAYGCTNRFKKGSGIGFYRFPRNDSRRSQWIKAIKRDNWEPLEETRICGQHFQSGMPNSDPNHPDFIPNVFVFSKPKVDLASFERRQKLCQKRGNNRNPGNEILPEVSSAILMENITPVITEVVTDDSEITRDDLEMITDDSEMRADNQIEDVEFRWRNLRKLYIRKEKILAGKNGNGACSSWPYFRHMNFLAPIVRHRHTISNRSISNRPIVIQCSQSLKPEDFTDEEVDEASKQLDSEMSVSSNAEETIAVETVNASSNVQKQTSPSLKNRTEAIERMIYSYLKNKESERDDFEVDDKDNSEFFKSLLPLCRGWQNCNKIRFRMDVLALIQKYHKLENENM